MTKKLFIIPSALVLAACALTTSLFGACSGGNDAGWNVSGDGGKITASLSDNGNGGYVLSLSGSGKMCDYASVKDAPWYGKSGRITDIVLSDGVTYVGDNAFAYCAAKTVVLPTSVSSVGENSFSSSTKVCAYSAVSVADGAKLYLYSENKPDSADGYWRFVDGTATVWSATKVLFIGNSFTYYSDIPSLFGMIAEGAGEFVSVDSVTMGAWTLTKFADATDAYGKIVDEKLHAADDYDVVVLQEQSTRPLNNYSAFISAAQSLRNKIESTQSNCRIVLYATWGYAEEAAGRNMTIPQMEAELRKAYENAAQTLGAEVSHVGAAFSYVYNTYPDMLNSASADSAYNLYFSDDKHPSYLGAYLSACVHAATILGCDPRASSYTGSLSQATADFLKNVAYQTVLGS